MQEEAKTEKLIAIIISSLEDGKGTDIVHIDMRNKSVLTDSMIIVSGRSHRHVNALASRLLSEIKKSGHKNISVEGMPMCDWVLIDVGDVIIHVFCPEVRAFYNLEKIWSIDQEDLECYA